MAALLKEYLTKLIPEDQKWKVSLMQNWDIIMGPLKDKVSIAQIKEGTLLLKVVHPAWAQELFLLSSMLKQKINTHLGASHINTIRFITEDIKVDKPLIQDSYLVRHRRKPYNEITVELSSKEEATLSNVHDPELKKALELFFVRCKHLRSIPQKSDRY